MFALLFAAACGVSPVNGFVSSSTSRLGTIQKSHLHATTAESESLSLFSPCKINLFLRIIRKRPDGFHDLASLFQAVGFGDTLTLSLNNYGDADEFTCNMEGVPTDSSNLVLRALQLMREKTGKTNVHFNADLFKRCPAQAGLGGGSANAATAMWGANELMGRPATLEQLIEWSGALGSDITFFLSRGTAYCTGRGEIMTPIDPPLPSGAKLSIVKPNLGLSTPKVFKALDYDQLSTEDPQMLCDVFLREGVVNTDDKYYINDLEQPAFDCLPELKALKDELLQVEGFDHVMMSGSGTSIFCIGEPTDKDAFMKEFDERDGVSVFNAAFINREEGSCKGLRSILNGERKFEESRFGEKGTAYPTPSKWLETEVHSWYIACPRTRDPMSPALVTHTHHKSNNKQQAATRRCPQASQRQCPNR
eukprot:scaffold274_cov144-Skeletonema_menzelii.AAC.31